MEESKFRAFEIAEEKRKKMKKSKSTLLVVFISLSVVSMCAIIVMRLSPFLFIGSILLLVVPFVVHYFFKSKLVDFVKKNAILPALKKIRPGISYSDSDYITESQFMQSNLFESPDRYNGEDLISGRNGKTEFVFSEIHAEKKHQSTDSDGNKETSYSTIFKGIFMIAEFNKHIKNETYVLTSGRKWWSEFKKVNLEDPDFESKFNVYSDNQIEARYILTPALMERIINLEKSFRSKLYLSFIGNNVFIALGNHKNYFEPDVDSEINQETMNKVIKEIDDCIEIVDDLNLNTRIWTKK